MPLVLLVDDDALARYAVEAILRNGNFDVLSAKNGKEALKILSETDPDIIITDIVMPEMEGLELIQKLRKTHPNIPVVAISGGGMNSTQGYLEMAKDLGAVEVLPKPFRQHDLLNTLDKLGIQAEKKLSVPSAR